jgi:hypothetical protein
MQSEIVSVSERTTQRGTVTGYVVELRHRGLNEVRTVGDRDHDTAIRKAQALGAKWNGKWSRLQEKQAVQSHKQATKEEADARTSAAEHELDAARNLLKFCIGRAKPLDWASRQDQRSFQFKDTARYPLQRLQSSSPVGGPWSQGSH